MIRVMPLTHPSFVNASRENPQVAATPLPLPPPRPSSSIAGDESPAALEDAEVSPGMPSPPSSSSSTSSSSPSGTSIAGDADGDAGAEVAETWPTEILGQRVQHVKGRDDTRWHYHNRLRVCCDNPGHHGCAKSRSTVLGVPEFGPQAPIIYLGAWLARSDMPRAQHRKYRPDAEAMRAFAATLQ